MSSPSIRALQIVRLSTDANLARVAQLSSELLTHSLHAAIDATYFDRQQASSHYLKRRETLIKHRVFASYDHARNARIEDKFYN